MGANLSQYLMPALEKNNIRNEDPREAILKFKDIAEQDPYWVAPAYQKNQSKPIFAKSVYEDEAEFMRDQKKRRRK